MNPKLQKIAEELQHIAIGIGREPLEIKGKLDLDPREVSRIWPNVTYEGKDIIHYWYPRFERIAKQYMDNKFPGGDRQECYLGYDPKKDFFVIGYDVWFDRDDSWGNPSGEIDFGCAYVEIDEGYMAKGGDYLVGGGASRGGFYPEGLKQVHRQYHGLVDLRLD